MQDYDIQIDIPTDNAIDSINIINILNISSIINKIDNLINDNTARINNIIQKAQKAKIKTAYHIEILKNESYNTFIGTDCTVSELGCTISYKDAYKIEKAKRTELQNQYNELQNQYNNYDKLVINKIYNEHNINIIGLQNYKSSAKERLNIIQERLNNNFAKDKTNLEDNIKLIQSKLYNNNNTIINLNTQIKNININLSTLDANKTELSILVNKINQIATIINTLQNDIKYLENN